MAGDGGHCWGRLGLLSLYVCVVVVCVCKGEREGKVTRGGHFKQATATMASAAVLNDCHVLVVSPSPPLLLLLLLLL